MESREADFSLYVEDGGFEGSLAVSSIVKQVRIRASDACLRLVMRRIGAKTGWVRCGGFDAFNRAQCTE